MQCDDDDKINTTENSFIVFANPGSMFLSGNMVTANMLLSVLFVSGELFVQLFGELFQYFTIRP